MGARRGLHPQDDASQIAGLVRFGADIQAMRREFDTVNRELGDVVRARLGEDVAWPMPGRSTPDRLWPLEEEL